MYRGVELTASHRGTKLKPVPLSIAPRWRTVARSPSHSQTFRNALVSLGLEEVLVGVPFT
jgi:hypothetical protein